jgi:O-antigen ligase/tetratricopeptide (TPR) repeat protein
MEDRLAAPPTKQTTTATWFSNESPVDTVLLDQKKAEVLSSSGTLALGVVVLLLVLAPLPEGSAYSWALAVVESVIFGLIAVWQFALAFSEDPDSAFARGREFLLPVFLFAVVVTVQLVPLPPALLRIVSPATYRLYELSLPGWPQTVDGIHPSEGFSSDSLIWKSTVRGTPGKTAHEARVFAKWRPLSIAPSVGERPVLKFAAYASLFFFVCLYAFGSAGGETERYLYRALVMAVLVSGLSVAVIGIVEFFTWNGKILWLFVPYDWGAPGPLARAVGPFVNPDHFGNYLALVLPLAAGGALFRDDLFSKQRAFPVFCVVTAFLALCALLLSASRGAWIATALAVTLLMMLSARMPKGARPLILAGPRGTLFRRVSVMALAVLAFSMFFIGQQARNQIDVRLQQAVQSDSGVGGRGELTEGTLAMARDYPLLGVGLGCWPELFSHYQAPPWLDVIFREAHDDYAQLLAETGVIGFGFVTWFFVVVGQRLYRAFIAEGPAVSPTLVALCAALAAMVFHEFFDFSLQTPANALLFTVLLALAVRMSMYSAPSQTEDARSPSWKLRMGAVCITAIVFVLIDCALRQNKTPYPYDVKEPKSVVEAVELISAHPAESSPHLELVSLAGESLSTQARLRELRAAVWLDPNDPYARDEYAVILLHQKMTAQAFDEITRSVMVSPSLSTHFYLSEGLIPRLTDQAKNAVEQGFSEGIERGYDGAAQGLADFYTALGRFADAGDIYRLAVQRERNEDIRENYLLNAGRTYVRAGRMEEARKFFEEAIRNEPTDDRPYADVTTLVLGPKHELKAAQSLIAQGIRAGADAAVLYQALAEAAQADGDSQLTETALRGAVQARPTLAALLRLGFFYITETKYARATLILRQATERDPRSAAAYYYLGLAEESDYGFRDAERDLARAVQLAPTNAGYRAHYAEFERKVAQSIKASHPLSE